MLSSSRPAWPLATMLGLQGADSSGGVSASRVAARKYAMDGSITIDQAVFRLHAARSGPSPMASMGW